LKSFVPSVHRADKVSRRQYRAEILRRAQLRKGAGAKFIWARNLLRQSRAIFWWHGGRSFSSASSTGMKDTSLQSSRLGLLIRFWREAQALHHTPTTEEGKIGISSKEKHRGSRALNISMMLWTQERRKKLKALALNSSTLRVVCLKGKTPCFFAGLSASRGRAYIAILLGGK